MPFSVFKDVININNLNQSVFEIDALEDEIVIFPLKQHTPL